MIRTLLSTTLVAGSLFAAQGDSNELTFATYDLEGLIPDGADQHDGLRILPLVLAANGEHYFDIEGIDSEGYDFLHSLLVDAIAPDLFEVSPVAMVRLLEDDQILIRAPSDVHARFSGLLAHFRAAAHRTATLTIDTYRSTSGIASDIDALANSARSGQAVLINSQRRTIKVGHSEKFESVQSVDILRSWEVEIAQNSAIADPDYENLAVGSSWRVRLEHPVGQKLRLRFAHRHSEIAAWEERNLGMESVVMLDGRVAYIPSVGVIDRPLVSTATNWGEAAMPAAGGTTWVAAQVATPSGPVSYISRISVSDVAPAPAPTKLNASTDAWLIDASHMVWRGFPSRLPVARDWSPTIGRDYAEEASERNVLEFPSGLLGSYELLIESVYDLPQAQDIPIEVTLLGSWFLIVGPQDVLAETAGLSKVLARPTRSASVDVVISRRSRTAGPGTGEVIGHTRLSVDARSRAGAIVGQQQPVITDYDVEVANGSATADPVVDSIFDGLAVEVRSLNSDSVALDIFMHLRRDASEMDLQAELIGVVDRIATFVGEASVDVPVDGKRHTWSEFAVEGDMVYDMHATARPSR